MKTTFRLAMDDMAMIARRHGIRCRCDVCEAYARERRRIHTAEQLEFLRQISERHGIPVEKLRYLLYKGSIGREVRKTRYIKRRYVLTAEDVENFQPRPRGNPDWQPRDSVVETAPRPPHGN